SWARPAPAAPTTARPTGRWIPAWLAARRAVSASTTAEAAAPPGFIADPGPSARPRIVKSAVPMTTVECEAPASAPSNAADGRALADIGYELAGGRAGVLAADETLRTAHATA